MEKKILDVTCGSRTIWFNKSHPAALYCDNRRESTTGIWKSTNRDSERTCIVDPDILCDFTDLPFPDDSFSLVVFDPPQLLHVGETSWTYKKYGKLGENWPQMLRDGFRECMRVLKPDGVLIFKWSETDIPAADVWKAIGEKPLFGHHSGKKMGTFWACFMKLSAVKLEQAHESMDFARTKDAKIVRLGADLARVTAERDGIEQNFREFTRQWWEEANGFPCRFCKFEKSGGCEQKEKHPDDEKPCAGRWFEWRGIKED